jgi:ATP-dependent RNA helicase DeaD
MFQTTRLVLDDAKYDKPNEPIKSAKYEELKNVLNELGDEKAIVFTSYKMILEKLYDNLSKDGYTAIKIDSEMSAQKRSELLKEFKNSKNIKTLLTSDIMSSGQNVNEAYAVIHYDLPLMASTISQRIGRINRLDQTRNSVLSIIISTDSKFDRTVENILNKKLVYGAVVKGETPSFSFDIEEMEEILKNVL